MVCISEKSVFLADEQATILAAHAFAKTLEEVRSNHQQSHLMVYLLGDLGAGKSFFSRALIQSFIPGQKVKSPTYTLVETYDAPNFVIHHFDLYRMCEPEELEYLGIRDLLNHCGLALVEWPQKGEGVLPPADVVIELQHLEEGRNFRLKAKTQLGEALLDFFKMA